MGVTMNISRHYALLVLSGGFMAVVKATWCGGGQVLTGECSNPNECCSQDGWCDVQYCPTPSPVADRVDDGPCGGGNRGNGVCVDRTKCCSNDGFCGHTDAHCFWDGWAWCGEENVGNGVCEDRNQCCSRWGFCGRGNEWCQDNGSDRADAKPTGPKPTLKPTMPRVDPTSWPTPKPTPAPTFPRVDPTPQPTYDKCGVLLNMRCMTVGAPPNQLCEAITPIEAVQCMASPTKLCFRYTAERCLDGVPRGRYGLDGCTDFNGGPLGRARVILREGASLDVFLNETLQTGDEICVDRDGETLPESMAVTIRDDGGNEIRQFLNLDLSCRGDGLTLNKQYGSLRLIGYSNAVQEEECLVEIMYEYEVTNSGMVDFLITEFERTRNGSTMSLRVRCDPGARCEMLLEPGTSYKTLESDKLNRCEDTSEMISGRVLGEGPEGSSVCFANDGTQFSWVGATPAPTPAPTTPRVDPTPKPTPEPTPKPTPAPTAPRVDPTAKPSPAPTVPRVDPTQKPTMPRGDGKPTSMDRAPSGKEGKKGGTSRADRKPKGKSKHHSKLRRADDGTGKKGGKGFSGSKTRRNGNYGS